MLKNFRKNKPFTRFLLYLYGVWALRTAHKIKAIISDILPRRDETINKLDSYRGISISS